MGTVLEITLVARSEAHARVLIERCFAETERLEMIFTTWREDGELARLNAKAGQGPQPASPELVRILLEAQRFTRETHGSFDVTIGPLVQLWRDAGERGVLPREDEIANVRVRVGAARMQIDEQHGRIALAVGMSADLGGFAKGWALDRLAELLRGAGTERALLNFGGSSLAALGTPLDAARWRVRNRDELLELPAGANVSISESFGQLVELGGQRLGHIIDPSTGWPIRREVRAVTRAATAALAEVGSKLFVIRNGGAGCARERAQALEIGGETITALVDCGR